MLKLYPNMRAALASVVAVMFCALAPVTVAAPVLTPQAWTMAGPGTISSTQVGNVSTLTYNINPAGFSTQTWTASAIADTSGDYLFNWAYNGFHAFFQVTAFLNAGATSLVNTGPNNCCSTPSGGFAYNGFYTFSNVNVGNTMAFTFGGSNFDSTNILIGSLTLNQVPEPGTLALLGLALGLAGFGAAHRKQKAAA